jgi:hypothetical protein
MSMVQVKLTMDIGAAPIKGLSRRAIPVFSLLTTPASASASTLILIQVITVRTIHPRMLACIFVADIFLLT